MTDDQATIDRFITFCGNSTIVGPSPEAAEIEIDDEGYPHQYRSDGSICRNCPPTFLRCCRSFVASQPQWQPVILGPSDVDRLRTAIDQPAANHADPWSEPSPTADQLTPVS